MNNRNKERNTCARIKCNDAKNQKRTIQPDQLEKMLARNESFETRLPEGEQKEKKKTKQLPWKATSSEKRELRPRKQPWGTTSGNIP